ncbi:MAG: GatB/YqeY domain-containing protein [Polyangiaceae bacterium]|nr:GatB/YqeY domain-containing protein [Polyangiaceae bacterium]
MLFGMLVGDIKKRVTAAVKEGDTVARDVLRLALGEIQTAEARKNAPLSEDEASATLRKLIKSNEETLALATGDATIALRHEIDVLRSLLPAQLDVAQIVTLLAPHEAELKAAKADGQAVGLAMKQLKVAGHAVSGSDVTLAVKRIRGAG